MGHVRSTMKINLRYWGFPAMSPATRITPRPRPEGQTSGRDPSKAALHRRDPTDSAHGPCTTGIAGSQLTVAHRHHPVRVVAEPLHVDMDSAQPPISHRRPELVTMTITVTNQWAPGPSAHPLFAALHVDKHASMTREAYLNKTNCSILGYSLTTCA